LKGSIIARRYAAGLGASILDSEYPRINSELEAFLTAFKKTELGEALSSYFISMEKKKSIIEEIAHKYKFHKKTRNFLILLIERRRIELFPLIMEFFHSFWNQSHNIHEFELVTAIKVDEKFVDEVKGILESKFKGEIRIFSKIDPSIIGGFILKKGFVVYDGSIKKQLELIKRKIIEGE